MEKQEKKQRFLSIPVSEDVYRSVRIKAAIKGKTVAAYVRSLVEDALKIQKI